MMPPTYAGLVNLNKPPGISSRAAVDAVKHLVRPAKTGHAGTLDPLACGVLVVCVGAATRLIEYVQAQRKRYLGTFLLGRESDTEDIEGEVRVLAEANVPGRDEIASAAARFVGQIEQRPPVYSALKLGGRRAYDLARAGQQVELRPRPVTIYRLDMVSYSYPELSLDIECGSGTYIRSLGRDLAQCVGTSAVMSALTRVAIGPFQLTDAWRPEQLHGDNQANWLQPPLAAVPFLDRIVLSSGELARLRQGLSIERAATGAAREAAGVDEKGDLRAILAVEANGTIRPLRNLL